jgi:hypothetical protein
MISLDDNRWQFLEGGYRVRFDPRPFLAKLAANSDTEAAWRELWEGLHHQGNVGEASYAAVPHLVQIHRQHGALDRNTYAIVSIIDLARDNSANPEIPAWLREGYFKAIRDLAELGAVELFQAKDPDDIQAILSVLAIAAGSRTHARIL